MYVCETPNFIAEHYSYTELLFKNQDAFIELPNGLPINKPNHLFHFLFYNRKPQFWCWEINLERERKKKIKRWMGDKYTIRICMIKWQAYTSTCSTASSNWASEGTRCSLTKAQAVRKLTHPPPLVLCLLNWIQFNSILLSSLSTLIVVVNSNSNNSSSSTDTPFIYQLIVCINQPKTDSFPIINPISYGWLVT